MIDDEDLLFNAIRSVSLRLSWRSVGNNLSYSISQQGRARKVHVPRRRLADAFAPPFTFSYYKTNNQISNALVSSWQPQRHMPVAAIWKPIDCLMVL